nr:stomatin-like protein 2, mitochondrial [Tanacetum cinerariifolium]
MTSLARYTHIAINEAAKDWGLTCLRYEIKDINPPPVVQVAMERQAEAERKKRASILDSEAYMLTLPVKLRLIQYKYNKVIAINEAAKDWGLTCL